ncbi:hypothetical protein GQ55_2G114500 [Panicum hallii var. hallii]|uniref:Uncharacterized protein n=1 Tax=Panicum hallii var. hallii TaxID=1504633 RepID=A0A2T7ENV8_9POAL|nr:hypothetical protein GQ55_2G114500 [Panicum hallii var. hallii]
MGMVLARGSGGGALAGFVLGRRAMETVAKGTTRAAVHGSRSLADEHGRRSTRTATTLAPDLACPAVTSRDHMQGREEAEEAIERGRRRSRR